MESYAVATFSFASIFTDNPAPNPVLLLAIETPFELKISDSPRALLKILLKLHHIGFH